MGWLAAPELAMALEVRWDAESESVMVPLYWCGAEWESVMALVWWDVESELERQSRSE